MHANTNYNAEMSKNTKVARSKKFSLCFLWSIMNKFALTSSLSKKKNTILIKKKDIISGPTVIALFSSSIYISICVFEC